MFNDTTDAIDNYVQQLKQQSYSSCNEILGHESPDFIIGYLLSDYRHMLRELKLSDEQLATLTLFRSR